ncbi:putative transposase [Wolbachia endosymbiont of Cimex lectularius]|nr:putative transposase [Wolbachia endosymbiont of Cimex lectularius]
MMRNLLQKCLILLILSINVCYAENVLLQAPQKVSEEDINRVTANHDSSMCFAQTEPGKWHVKWCWNSCIDSGNSKSGFQLSFNGDDLIKELTKQENVSLSDKEGQKNYEYGCVVSDKRLSSKRSNNTYHFAQTLYVRNATPNRISVPQVVKLINDKNVVFYTGAGISALVVPDVSELNKQFGVAFYDRNLKQDDAIALIHKILKEPEKFAKIIDNFYKACLYGIPTSAHYAVKNIALLKNWQLLTENVDLLHQRSGIEVLGNTGGKMNFDWLMNNIKPEHLRQIDFIVTCGLNSDTVGFLALYKKHNPKGKIIAMNLVQPNYLGDDDILVAGDLQETLPDLFENLSRL